MPMKISFLVSLFEAALLWDFAGAAIFMYARPGYMDFERLLSAFRHTTVLTLCCILSFYWNGLYDFRIARNFRDFGPRLFRSFGLAFILLAVYYAFLAAVEVPSGRAFGISLLAIVSVLLPSRSLWYALMRHALRS